MNTGRWEFCRFCLKGVAREVGAVVPQQHASGLIVYAVSTYFQCEACGNEYLDNAQARSARLEKDQTAERGEL